MRQRKEDTLMKKEKDEEEGEKEEKRKTRDVRGRGQEDKGNCRQGEEETQQRKKG